MSGPTDESREEIQACVVLGLPLKAVTEQTHDGNWRTTITTKYPCALVGDTLYYKRTDNET